MNSLSLIEALENCTDSCGWCVHHCPDKDKYEMLVSCIQIQEEFLIVSNIVNKILSDKSGESMKKIFKLFEFIADYLQMINDADNKKNFTGVKKSEDGLRLPGCSQIFLVAQSLQKTYLSEFSKVE